MPTFDVDREQITVFKLDDTYVFKQYFDHDALFDGLRPYYNEAEYRFEVPNSAFNDVQDLLQEHFYELEPVSELEPFCVVWPKDGDQPDVLYKTAVLSHTHKGYHVFLLKDQLSVEQAVHEGAERLAETDIDVDVTELSV